ncbi:LppX_LprAFG lipoprotein [Chloroflexota bacterium]
MRFTGLIILSGLLVLLMGCTEQAPPPPDPLDLVTQAAQHIQDADTFAVTIERAGAPVYVDPNGLINFLRANGHYVAPDSVQATVRVLFQSLASDIDVIAVGDDQYFRHTVLTGGQWFNGEFSPGFNAEELIRSESGLVRVMSAITDLELVGQKSIDGTPMWHLQGSAIGSEVSALTIGLIPAQADVEIDLYIRVDNNHAERMTIVQPDTVTVDEPEPSTWTVEIFDYNGAYTVEIPG